MNYWRGRAGTMVKRAVVIAAIGALAAGPVRAQKPSGLCAQVKPLVSQMASLGMLLPASVRARLIRLAGSNRSSRIDTILSGYSLLEIQINPESRVKVARGMAKATLVQRKETLFLVRIANEAGVTAPLRISGPNLVLIPSTESRSGRNRWLIARVFTLRGERSQPILSGAPLEYGLVALSTTESGLREATLVFDVGQGTQDLGFRGETSILFHCRASGGP